MCFAICGLAHAHDTLQPPATPKYSKKRHTQATNTSTRTHTEHSSQSVRTKWPEPKIHSKHAKHTPNPHQAAHHTLSSTHTSNTRHKKPPQSSTPRNPNQRRHTAGKHSPNSCDRREKNPHALPTSRNHPQNKSKLNARRTHPAHSPNPHHTHPTNTSNKHKWNIPRAHAQPTQNILSIHSKHKPNIPRAHAQSTQNIPSIHLDKNKDMPPPPPPRFFQQVLQTWFQDSFCFARWCLILFLQTSLTNALSGANLHVNWSPTARSSLQHSSAKKYLPRCGRDLRSSSAFCAMCLLETSLGPRGFAELLVSSVENVLLQEFTRSNRWRVVYHKKMSRKVTVVHRILALPAAAMGLASIAQVNASSAPIAGNRKKTWKGATLFLSKQCSRDSLWLFCGFLRFRTGWPLNVGRSDCAFFPAKLAPNFSAFVVMLCHPRGKCMERSFCSRELWD